MVFDLLARSFSCWLLLGVFVSRKDAKGKGRKGILFEEGFSDLLASLLFAMVVSRRFCFHPAVAGQRAKNAKGDLFELSCISYNPFTTLWIPFLISVSPKLI